MKKNENMKNKNKKHKWGGEKHCRRKTQKIIFKVHGYEHGLEITFCDSSIAIQIADNIHTVKIRNAG